MKRFLFLAFFLLTLHSVSFAQQWRPVLSGKTQYFIGPEVNGNDSMIWGFKTTFSHVQGLDSVFTFNRIVRQNEPFVPFWDTCQGVASLVVFDSLRPLIRNQSNVPGENMVAHNGGGFSFAIASGDTVHLHPQAPLGIKWLWRSGTTDSAWVVARSWQSVLGTMDSIAEIAVSNGKAYHISQNHGFLQWPYHLPIRSEWGDLAAEASSIFAIPEIGFGNSVPTFSDFTHFDPGDKILLGFNSAVGYSYSEWHDFHTVVSQTAAGNIQSYETIRNRTENGISQGFTPSTLIYRRNPLFDLLPGEYYFDSSSTTQWIAPLFLYLKKEHGHGGRISRHHSAFYLYDSCNVQAIGNNYDWSGYFRYTVYLEGLGYWSGVDAYTSTISNSSYDTQFYLICYQKVGEAIHGSCNSQFEYVSVAEELPQPRLSLYPNPANHELTLKLDGEWGKGCTLTLIDGYGSILFQMQSDSERVFFSTESFPDGIYLVLVESKYGHRAVRKLLIAH